MSTKLENKNESPQSSHKDDEHNTACDSIPFKRLSQENDNVEEIQNSILAEMIDNNDSQGQVIKNDKELELLTKSDLESLVNHNASYNSILTNYGDNLKDNTTFKREAKRVFFWMSIVVLGVTTLSIIALVATVIYKSYTGARIEFKDFILPMATATTSFMTSFIVIPKVIAEYLFDSKEEEASTRIVERTQEYDRQLRLRYNSK